ncbi:hypothetical protein PLICRDRAFT_179861 [Plicaturopsis crispa FD-325 SS-3]|uniref:Protein kinase domain-containing protein n=1 Tax=Plicaturopsis crispa FD-325 SS-3 TaxID=944288 RepID=A0A0C9SX83_PLICR|nr:hypothetical protein PLICRDRAFT_179861 [Plicaturopsis crispa FD-325 SS-3]
MPLQDDPEFDLDITIDIQPLVEELRGLREVALYTPLHTGAEFLIKLNRVTPHARGRPLPRGFARQIPTRRAGGQYYTVVLERAIQTKRNSWGQVWVARVSDPADSDSEQNDSDLPVLGHIVVKIVQPSLLPHPNPDSYHQWEYIPPKNVACTEDWMYGQLQALQGREVPCYYGMQTVVTPCGESAWLLAMEYVEGETLSRWLDSCHDDPGNWRRPNDLTPEVFDKFKQLLTSGIEGVMAIHAQSVFHGDVRRPNLIIAKAFPVGPRVVFIDLALGREIDDFPSAVDGEIMDVCDQFLCCPAHATPITAWAEKGPLPNGWVFGTGY